MSENKYTTLSAAERRERWKLIIDNIENNLLKHSKSCTMRYITGTSSFNIPYQGILCDWHQSGMLKKDSYTVHPIKIIGAEKIFDDYGLFDCTGFFINNNKDIQKLCGTTLCANPIRALIDVLYYNIVIENRYPNLINNMENDYMFEEIDFMELSKQLKKLSAYLNKSQSILFERWKKNNGIK